MERAAIGNDFLSETENMRRDQPGKGLMRRSPDKRKG